MVLVVDGPAVAGSKWAPKPAGLCVSGDTIFPGSCGRLDLPDASAGRMFDFRSRGARASWRIASSYTRGTLTTASPPRQRARNARGCCDRSRRRSGWPCTASRRAAFARSVSNLRFFRKVSVALAHLASRFSYAVQSRASDRPPRPSGGSDPRSPSVSSFSNAADEVLEEDFLVLGVLQHELLELGVLDERDVGWTSSGSPTGRDTGTCLRVVRGPSRPFSNTKYELLNNRGVPDQGPTYPEASVALVRARVRRTTGDLAVLEAHLKRPASPSASSCPDRRPCPRRGDARRGHGARVHLVDAPVREPDRRPAHLLDRDDADERDEVRPRNIGVFSLERLAASHRLPRSALPPCASSSLKRMVPPPEPPVLVILSTTPLLCHARRTMVGPKSPSRFIRFSDVRAQDREGNLGGARGFFVSGRRLALVGVPGRGALLGRRGRGRRRERRQRRERRGEQRASSGHGEGHGGDGDDVVDDSMDGPIRRADSHRETTETRPRLFLDATRGASRALVETVANMV